MRRSSRLPRLSQRRQFLLLIRCQDLIDLRHRGASDRGQLTHLAAFGGRQLLDLRRVIGLNRRPQRLPRLLQLLPDRLSRLPRVLENRLRLRLLRCASNSTGWKRTRPFGRVCDRRQLASRPQISWRLQVLQRPSRRQICF